MKRTSILRFGTRLAPLTLVVKLTDELLLVILFSIFQNSNLIGVSAALLTEDAHTDMCEGLA
jgi:hypothetical protein